MNWFEAREKSAGKKRLILTYFIYKVFGRTALYITAFFVSFFTFIFSKDLRFYSKKYLQIVSKYTKIKPSAINQFRHVFSYAVSLADKIIMYSGGFSAEDIYFENFEDKEQLFYDIKKGKGICFLFPHIGCIEILQAYFGAEKEFPNLKVNILLNKTQTKIFNDFINSIKKPMPAEYITAEDFGIQEALKLKETTEKGGVLFASGDRISEFNSSKIIKKKMFSHHIKLPEGVFRLAELLETPVYYIAVLKTKKGYRVIIKKLNKNDYAEGFLRNSENTIIKYPLQFYHFYDFFAE